MKKVLNFIIHEFKEMLWITIYFLFAFGFMGLIKYLVLAQNKIEYYRITGIFVGAAIMSKVILILDRTRMAQLFKKEALYKNVLLKTVIYTLVAVLMVWLEHAAKVWINTDYNWTNTVHEIQAHRDPNQMGIVISASFVTLLIYNLFQSVREYLGETSIFSWFMKAKINN